MLRLQYQQWGRDNHRWIISGSIGNWGDSSYTSIEVNEEAVLKRFNSLFPMISDIYKIDFNRYSHEITYEITLKKICPNLKLICEILELNDHAVTSEEYHNAEKEMKK
jgi:hypothetical protein